jgi:PIN domain nuclease of toxin-antitoxin system
VDESTLCPTTTFVARRNTCALTWLVLAAVLPPIHQDLSGRFIIATAVQNDAPVVTADTRFAAYGVKTLL